MFSLFLFMSCVREDGRRLKDKKEFIGISAHPYRISILLVCQVAKGCVNVYRTSTEPFPCLGAAGLFGVTVMIGVTLNHYVTITVQLSLKLRLVSTESTECKVSNNNTKPEITFTVL